MSTYMSTIPPSKRFFPLQASANRPHALPLPTKPVGLRAGRSPQGVARRAGSVDAHFKRQLRERMMQRDPSIPVAPVWPYVDARLQEIQEDYGADAIESVLSTADKLGDSRWARAFNLALQDTCCAERVDGSRIATAVCHDRCYAHNESERQEGMFGRAQGNYIYILEPDFSDLMCAAILKYEVHLMRIHSIGDFHQEEYIRKWTDIVKRNPWTEFLAYTRAWRVPDLVPSLTDLAAEPNMSLWLSVDRKSGFPPPIKGMQICHLADTDSDGPAVHGSDCHRVNLVFRASAACKRVKRMEIDGVQVCPHENGTGKDTTCWKCRLCLFKEK